MRVPRSERAIGNRAAAAAAAPPCEPQGDRLLDRPRRARLARRHRRPGDLAAERRPPRPLARRRLRGHRRPGRRPPDRHAAVALPRAPVGDDRRGRVHALRLAQPGEPDRAGLPDPDGRQRARADRAALRAGQRDGHDRVGGRPDQDPRPRPGDRRPAGRRPHRQHAGDPRGRDMTVLDTTHVDPSWRRLSRRMLLVHPVQEVPRALPAIIGILVAGSANGHAWWGLATLVLVMAAGVLRWFTTSYRITPDNVQVRRGLVRRRELSVPRDRVRTVDVTAHAIHRLVGLTRVTVGTGRSDRKDDGIKLDGLTPQEAARLRVELLHLRKSATEVPKETQKTAESVVAKLEPRWIRYGPF